MISDQKHEVPHTTVDAALFTLYKNSLHVLLTRRDQEPFKDELALPGGYIHIQEDMDSLHAIKRVILQKVGVIAPYLEQLYTFSGKDRDPRGWSVSVAYFAVVPSDLLLGSEQWAYGNRLVFAPVDSLPKVVFDHEKIIKVGLERLRNKSTYSSLPAFLMPKTFTMQELQKVYEQVLGVELDRILFRKRMERHIVEKTGVVRKDVAHRPPELFRLTTDTLKQFGRDMI